MGWMLLLCRRCRTRWRMSSDPPAGGRGLLCGLRPPVGVRVFVVVVECDVLWRQG